MSLVRSGCRVCTLVAAMAVALVAAASSPAIAHEQKPLAYLLLCLKSPADCSEGGAPSIVLSDEVLATLNSVNRTMNHTITPRNDPGTDQWGATASGGDCEDFAVAKRRALVNAGLPPSALGFAYVRTPQGKPHVLLVVVTSKGELVLDNLTDEIKPLSRTGYKVISRF